MSLIAHSSPTVSGSVLHWQSPRTPSEHGKKSAHVEIASAVSGAVAYLWNLQILMQCQVLSRDFFFLDERLDMGLSLPHSPLPSTAARRANSQDSNFVHKLDCSAGAEAKVQKLSALLVWAKTLFVMERLLFHEFQKKERGCSHPRHGA